MTTLREAAERALDALEWAWGGEPLGTKEIDAITALRDALADQSEQALGMANPVAWIFTWYEIAKDRHVRRIIDCEERPNIPGYDLIPLYTHPPQRKPLTDQQKLDLVTNWFAEDWAIEKALGLLRDYDIERAHGIGSEE